MKMSLYLYLNYIYSIYMNIIHSKDHPLKKSVFSKRFRFDYSNNKSIHRTDVDAIRIASQFIIQPSFTITKKQFIGDTPREHFKIDDIISHLPVINIDYNVSRTKKVEMKLNKYNQLLDCMVVSTKDLQLFIDNKEVRNIYKDKHYTILRLRKNEGIELHATLEWNFNDSITSSKMSLLTPPVYFDDTKKTMDIIIESRMFYTADEIMEQSISYIINRLEKYYNIIKYVTNESSTKIELNSKHSNEFNYKIIEKETNVKENTYSLDIETPNLIDFDLCTKNVLAHIFNSTKDSVFVFEYFSTIIKFAFVDKKTINSILKEMENKLVYWNLTLKQLSSPKTITIDKKEDKFYFKYFD